MAAKNSNLSESSLSQNLLKLISMVKGSETEPLSTPKKDSSPEFISKLLNSSYSEDVLTALNLAKSLDCRSFEAFAIPDTLRQIIRKTPDLSIRFKAKHLLNKCNKTQNDVISFGKKRCLT
jgi:hypothetical protein